MSFPVIEEYISTYFVCKGTWIPITHCVLRSKNAKINEKYGYCSVCWEQDFKRNSHSTDFKGIEPEVFKQCGPDTL